MSEDNTFGGHGHEGLDLVFEHLGRIAGIQAPRSGRGPVALRLEPQRLSLAWQSSILTPGMSIRIGP